VQVFGFNVSPPKKNVKVDILIMNENIFFLWKKKSHVPASESE
jgi:hypothetical protein